MTATPDNQKVCDLLNDLIQLDLDAVKAYQSAIDRISVPTIAERLSSFQRDHERHVQNLTAEVRRLGGTPAERRDLKGPFIQGFTAIMSMMGVEEALRAMRSNEELTNKTYEDVLRQLVPADVRVLVEENLRDEQRHLAYIQEALRDRIWEAEYGAHI